ncbi:MAG: hypothetical protein AAGE94_19750, partial [Acidobacteriota bacterium]
VRLHGRDLPIDRAREGVMDRARAVFSDLAASSETPPKRRRRLPPVDVEDEERIDRPDRSVLWTTYRRGDVSFARAPFHADDEYVRRAVAAMSHGTTCLTEALVAETEAVRHATRQQILLQSVLVALAGFGFVADDRARYLRYHRDWLIRFALLGHEVGEMETRRLLDRLDRRAESMDASASVLRQTLDALTAEARPRDPSDPWSRYRDGLTALIEHVRSLAESPRFRIDPFAPRRTFPPLFKVLHAQANQLGLSMLDEAFAHHLVLRAVGGATDEPVTLVPSGPPV